MEQQSNSGGSQDRQDQFQQGTQRSGSMNQESGASGQNYSSEDDDDMDADNDMDTDTDSDTMSAPSVQ